MSTVRSGFHASLRPFFALASLAPALAFVLSISGCVDPPKPTAPSPTIVTGRVVYSDDVNRGVPGVLARVVGKATVATTDSTGAFSLSPGVTDGELLQLTFAKAGFDEYVTTLNVRAARANALPAPIPLVRSTTGGGGGTGSGVASSVVVRSVSHSSIGVRHSGSNETARVVFEARDAQGRPVDFGHRATLRFTLNQGAGGDATIAPDTVSTDETGLAAATVQSGIKAQAVQVRAQVVGTGVFSDPVPIAIHGGLPDPLHLSFAAQTLNVHGLVYFGLVDPITAFVGDRYGNPVVPGTVVYFTTTGGIIQGSATTDDHGRASVDLITAAPTPNDLPAFTDSAGIARITVQTMGENEAAIRASALAVMFSGHTTVSISPSTFAVDSGGSQLFTVTVRDAEHHNPLVKGTKITFTTTLGTIGGSASFELPDTRDPAYTSFTFRLENPIAGPVIVMPNRRRVPLVAARPAAGTIALASTSGGAVIDAVQPATVTVQVTSPNGNATATASGTLTRR